MSQNDANDFVRAHLHSARILGALLRILAEEDGVCALHIEARLHHNYTYTVVVTVRSRLEASGTQSETGDGLDPGTSA